jgi:hypothetical protein
MKITILPSIVLLIQFLQLSFGQDCSLIVPPNPLSATGLATPYLLVSNDPTNPCNQSLNGASFVQGAVINPRTGEIAIYNPIVIDIGSHPAAAPIVPTLPSNAIVGLWFGTNGDSLTLLNDRRSLSEGNCVNGARNSIFGQFAYCNAVAFFAAANSLIENGKITVPPLGEANDGEACPTTRDFFIIDQDQSDNVVTSYLLVQTSASISPLVAQNTAANRLIFPSATVLDNGSDERLVVAVDTGLGCTPWNVKDLADPSNSVASLPFNELFGQYRQKAPVALVPLGDPMCLTNNGGPDLEKVNLYRVGVSQVIANNARQASTKTYCQNFGSVFPQRMMNSVTQTLLSAQPSPANTATNLFTFLAARFEVSFSAGELNCTGLLGIPSPITVTFDSNGVANGVNMDQNLISNAAIWQVDNSTDISSKDVASTFSNSYKLEIGIISLLFSIFLII